MSSKARQLNQPSILLQRDENDTLFQLTGPKCIVLASGVAQVFLAEAPSYGRWIKRHVGVVTFVKDNGRRSYFVRLYDVEAHLMLWEQEIYTLFQYHVLQPFFHSFDTDECPAALNFASEDEASAFKTAVMEYLNKREKRRSDRTPSNLSTTTSPPKHNPTPIIVKPMMINQPAVQSNFVSNGETHHLSKKDKKKSKKVKIDKKDIGNPSDFRHVNHVGWDPDNGFDMNNIDPDMANLFNKVGLTGDKLQDKDTADFVYSFIEKRGGLDAVKKDSQRPTISQFVPPVNPPPRPPPSIKFQPPVPAPNRMSVPKPPGPPPRSPPTPPPSRSRTTPPLPITPAPLPVGVPPPPPPPPPPPMPSLLPSKPASLLDEIHKGRDLHHVEVEEAPATEVGRNALLGAIRGGVALRTVTKEEQAEREEVVEEKEDSLAGALMRALNNRAMALRSDDDDGENEEDDEEWDD